MYNSVDDFDLYSSIQSDKEYLTIKLIAIGFSLLLCKAILFFKRERNEIIIDDDVNDNKDSNV
jgi:hypothetical protein